MLHHPTDCFLVFPCHPCCCRLEVAGSDITSSSSDITSRSGGSSTSSSGGSSSSSSGGGPCRVYTKGASELVLERCSHVLGPDGRRRALGEADKLRLLADFTQGGQR